MMLRSVGVACISLSAMLLVACGGDNDGNKKSNTQVVAKVNGDEISVHQVNLQLARLGNLKEEQGKEAAEQILRKLVEQQLLNQQASAAKLDRDPRVLQMIEASKSEILAQAYLEKIAANAKKPSEADISSFYKEHPELFEKRRIFQIQELVVNAPAEKFSEIEAGIKDIQEINQIATWLNNNQFPFSANSNVKAAEQLPANLLAILQPLDVGKYTLVKTDKALAVLHLAAAQSSPITLDKAKPIIQQYYLNLNKATLIKDEMDALKGKANVEFMGAFAGMPLSIEKAVETKQVVPSTTPNQQTQENSKPEDASGIKKGLAGF